MTTLLTIFTAIGIITLTTFAASYIIKYKRERYLHRKTFEELKKAQKIR